ncbi:Starch-binding associating with outer membrane [Zhouia amylolytica]|uniref:Starch-binding associating with outer membrane n=1 Tax=Zhouia amylolytica TaxID=376730 RepID=A0A1I6VCF8_9FLAO|nr:RagB/SusD family nutrient uptake outer membrane protein [Zhouia amylolytica]MCQ0110412.1 RagB/SusD family nutrient uptake outer membrane protein [Zhouia amylolytica]SFT11315.1 Starch-binding associating with outer membrane [Zhouia amylolytica]
MRKIFIITTILITCFSCEKQLTKEAPFISENVVFESENLTEAYIADIYSRSAFQVASNENMGLISAVGAEHINFANWQTPNNAFIRLYSEETGPGPLDRWNFFNIRNMNYLLENIESSETLSQEYIQAKKAEVRFLRAYDYFEMVKRFGGVPIVTKVQNQSDPEAELYVSRNTEQEVYDFIYNETQAILDNFDNSAVGADGRVDKYTVLMLQSRAMLYAASIAKNGEEGPNGVTGIPGNLANSYYQKSYDASMEVINSGMFSLINAGDDKVSNYASIFLTEGSSNPETIFAEVFEPVIKGHNLDLLATPAGFNATWNSNFPVLYDFVELFDFTDGRSGKIDRSLFNSETEWDINDFFGNRDPRFRASVFYPESEWQGESVWFHNNTILSDGTKVNSTTQTITRIDGTEMPQASEPRNRRNTALLLRKRVDENNPDPSAGQSGQDFIVFRYAETLLNFAEAAFYLGNTGEALDAINQIRERAGMPLRIGITEDNIRQERQVELCFENHRFWDLIRWRIADQYLDQVRTRGLVYSYNLDSNKYIITLKNAETQIRSFGPERYYLPFAQGRLADNPNLVQNPGY